MDALEALSRSRHEFESRLRQVGDDQWDLPTPCSDWTVRELVDHMLLGTRMTVELLGGASQADTIASLEAGIDSDDPLGDFIALADQMQQGFAAEGGLDGTVDHPMGEIPRSLFVHFRMTDNAAHAWDLARAIGADEHLDDELIETMWNDIQPMAGGLAETGMFGDSASGTVGEDAPLQTRWLDLLGRRP